jgi:hypothetical protein
VTGHIMRNGHVDAVHRVGSRQVVGTVHTVRGGHVVESRHIAGAGISGVCKVYRGAHVVGRVHIVEDASKHPVGTGDIMEGRHLAWTVHIHLHMQTERM